jgi:hypothetical protein
MIPNPKDKIRLGGTYTMLAVLLLVSSAFLAIFRVAETDGIRTPSVTTNLRTRSMRDREVVAERGDDVRFLRDLRNRLADLRLKNSELVASIRRSNVILEPQPKFRFAEDWQPFVLIQPHSSQPWPTRLQID